MGLVLLVTALVKVVTSPITPAEKDCAPLMTEAANADPGKLGAEKPFPPEPEVEGAVLPIEPAVEAAGRKLGS